MWKDERQLVDTNNKDRPKELQPMEELRGEGNQQQDKNLKDKTNIY